MAAVKGKGKQVKNLKVPKQASKVLKPSNQDHHKPHWLRVRDLASSQQSNQVSSQRLEHKSGSVPGNSPEMEKVEGVRRIWGTVRDCTSRTILTVLQKFSTVAERVEVRRKKESLKCYKKKGKAFRLEA